MHIKVYCHDVAKAIVRFGDDYDTFESDTDYFNSISMSIMQIAELSIGLSDEFKQASAAKMQWEAIRSMRNMYAHAYAAMDKPAIWQTATIDIPDLLKFCDNLLGQKYE